jgi:maltose alpha-D-glucosyltransferase/alpha-amylase
MGSRTSHADKLWYKDAIIYQVHVRTFMDSNADGVGDFPGLTSRLDYIARLGVTAIWLLPFYPSPLKDDGYDIAHYEGVHPSYGSLRDFRHLLKEAHSRGLRVITELVINHTSDQHPWFQAARRAAAGSTKRDFYVWSDTPARYPGVRIIFNDTEASNWTWDPEAGAYFWHRFFSHQPDLNFDNPRVVRAVLKVMKFWFDLGVDGLRLDAVPYLVEREGTICENLPETHAILKRIRRELDAAYPDRMLLAEANQWPADVRPYFGDGDESHMAFHFPLMPRLFMAVKQEDRYPIVDVLRQTPDIPETCQWATFLRNHDELTLEMVTSEERDFMWQQYAADPQMRINMGIRRRLAPLLENDRQRIELLNSLLFSLPGTPVVYYGDEIGMGDNVFLGDRNGVRTPMQWTGDRNAGFSRADPARLFAPPIMDAVYGYQGLNVEAQERSPSSLLNWMRRIIAIRKQYPVFGRGSIEFIEPDNPRILAFVREHAGERVLVVANLARSVQPVELDLARYAGLVPVEMFERTVFPRLGTAPQFFTLAPYGVYWFALMEQAAITAPARLAPRGVAVDEAPALLVGPVWDQMFDGHVRTLIERRCLERFLSRQSWYTAAACPSSAPRIEDWTVVVPGAEPKMLATVLVHCEQGPDERYLLPLATASGEAAARILAERPAHVLARITGARTGVLYEGLPDDFAHGLHARLQVAGGAATAFRTLAGQVEARRVSMEVEAADPATRIQRPNEARHAVALIGDRWALKLMRRVEGGPHPELELPRHLTAAAPGIAPRPVATLEYRRDGSDPATIAILSEQLPFQRNAWDVTIDEIGRFFERLIAHPDDEPAAALLPAGPLAVDASGASPQLATELVGGYLETAAMLGRRVADLHNALAQPAAGDAFGVVPDDGTYVDDVVQAMRSQAATLPPLIARAADRLDPAAHATLSPTPERVTGWWKEVGTIAERAGGAVVTMRVHGDLQLGQVLLHQGEARFVDFEGDPARPVEWRRRRHSPLRDVATLVHSLRYAAHAALLAYTASRPFDLARLNRWLEVWYGWSARAVLRAYRTSVDPRLRMAPEQDSALLHLLLVDQALQDLEMELRDRPDWASVPLATLASVGHSG